MTDKRMKLVTDSEPPIVISASTEKQELINEAILIGPLALDAFMLEPRNKRLLLVRGYTR